MSDHPGRMKIDEKTNSEEDNSSKEIPITIDEGSSASVSFLQLWKYATKGEIILNIIGLICASGAGAIQPSLGMFRASVRTYIHSSKP